MNSDPKAPISESSSGSSASERRTAGWDLRNAIRNYSSLVVAQVTVALFSFASVWLVTRYLGTEGYGGVVAVIAASQVVLIFVNWTGVSLTRFGVEEFVETGRITDSFWARTAILIPNTLILLVFGVLWLPLLASGLKLPHDAMWYVAAHFAATAFSLHIQNAVQAAKLPQLQGVLLAVERILIFAVLGILLAAGRLDGMTAVAAYIAAPAVVGVAGLFAIRRMFSWRISIKIESIKRLLRFSVPLIPYSLIGYFSTNYLDAIFISQYLSKSDLGVYSVSYQMNGILMQFPLLAGTLLLPMFVTLRSGAKNSRVTSYIEDLLPLLTFVGGLVGVCAGVAIRFIIPQVLGLQADQSVIIFWILMSSAVAAIPTVIGFAPYINAVSATYIASLLALVAASVNFAANYLLIPQYGLKGCAWATVISYIATLLAVVLIGHFKFSLRHRWTIPALLPTLTASGYASLTGDLLTAVILAIGVSFVIVLIWRKALADGINMLKNYRNFVAG